MVATHQGEEYFAQTGSGSLDHLHRTALQEEVEHSWTGEELVLCWEEAVAVPGAWLLLFDLDDHLSWCAQAHHFLQETLFSVCWMWT